MHAIRVLVRNKLNSFRNTSLIRYMFSTATRLGMLLLLGCLIAPDIVVNQQQSRKYESKKGHV
jgi:hypothetical protein